MTFQQRLAMAKAKRESEREAKEREFLFRYKSGEAFTLTLKFRCSMCKTVSLYESGKTDDGICTKCKPSENALVNVLYEQALRQAELLAELEEALNQEEWDREAFTAKMEIYLQGEREVCRFGD